MWSRRATQSGRGLRTRSWVLREHTRRACGRAVGGECGNRLLGLVPFVLLGAWSDRARQKSRREERQGLGLREGEQQHTDGFAAMCGPDASGRRQLCTRGVIGGLG
eukprot:2691458-Prymnesium_polylepis.1